MQGLAEAIKYFYQQFILRDVVAYVTPGTILAACLLRLHFGDQTLAVNFIKSLPTIAYIPIYGLLFTMGLGIQHLGEVMKVLEEFHRPTREKRFHKLQEFHRAVLLRPVTNKQSEYTEVMERTRERIEIKRYACGNIALALVLAGILILIAKFFPNLARWAILVTGVILAGSLLRAHHRVHDEELRIWEDGEIDFHKASTVGSNLKPS